MPALLVVLLSLLLAPAPAIAGNRYADCGGNGQRACCAFPEFRLPSCDGGLVEYLGGPGAGQGPFGCSLGTCYTPQFPAACGRDGQRPCSIFEHIPSCMSGLVELPFGVRCTLIDAAGFPSFCGDAGERPCTLLEHIPSCKPSLIEEPPLVGCSAIDADGYPEVCGGADEPACTVAAQLLLVITSCKPDLYEHGFPSGTCRALDRDGFPLVCGDLGQGPCDTGLQTQLLIAPCKPGLALGSGLCQLVGAAEPDLATTATVAPTPPGTPVFGIADVHAHVFAAEGFGGRVIAGEAFHPYGVAGALASCEKSHGPLGVTDLIGDFADGQLGHSNQGFPLFDAWPRASSSNHQQMYWRWLERAHRGGLRLLVMHAVNNPTLCAQSVRRPGYGCDDMEAVDRQLQAARELVAFVDAQSGGPGQGFFQIAESASEARSLVENGKLAVVLGIEVPALFGCKVGACDAAHVRAKLDAYYALGVRHVFPLHGLDNAFGGTALFEPLYGVSNRGANGAWFQVADCAALGHPGLDYDANIDPLSALLALLGVGSTPPAYAPANGHCNARGLTPLGDTLLREMMARHMIIDVDHMGAETLEAALALAESQAYPVVSGHASPLDRYRAGYRAEVLKSAAHIARIRDLGGLVAPILHFTGAASAIEDYGPVPDDCDESSKSFAQVYAYVSDQMAGGPYLHAVPIGSDLNGFIQHPGPRFGSQACAGNAGQRAAQASPVVYPFAAFGGAGTFGRMQTGARTWDVNSDGLAHVGLLPDFIQDLRNVGVNDAALEPLFRSAEAYLQLWERIEATADIDGDGTLDAADNCAALSNTDQADADADGVGQVCDTCPDVANPRVSGGSSKPWMTLVGGQRDDDADGLGNACDFDYDQAGPVVLAADFNEMKRSVAKLALSSSCGVSGARRCAAFDHDGVGPVIAAADFNRAKAQVGRLVPPSCGAACTPPFGSPDKLTCSGPAC